VGRAELAGAAEAPAQPQPLDMSARPAKMQLKLAAAGPPITRAPRGMIDRWNLKTAEIKRDIDAGVFDEKAVRGASAVSRSCADRLCAEARQDPCCVHGV
jgi:hypothetical protein